MESTYGRRRADLVFRNTFRETLSGQLRINVPRDWELEPLAMPFVVDADKSVTVPLKVRCPRNEPAGAKWLNVRFRIHAPTAMEIHCRVPFELGSSALHTRAWWFLRGPNVVVQQEIENRGRRSMNLVSFLIAPQRPRQERRIPRLPAGQKVVKQYLLEDWSTLLGKKVRLGLREVGGQRILSDLITIQ